MPILLWLLMHASVTAIENPERADAHGRPEVTVWVKVTDISW